MVEVASNGNNKIQPVEEAYNDTKPTCSATQMYIKAQLEKQGDLLQKEIQDTLDQQDELPCITKENPGICGAYCSSDLVQCSFLQITLKTPT